MEQAGVTIDGGEGVEAIAGVGMPLERLEAEICELAGHLAAGECRWLLLLSEFDRREGWAGHGIQSCAHWVSHRCGIGLQAAREKLRVGRRLGELPRVRAAFAGGQLSYSKVRAVCRVATPEKEEVLLELARWATTSQLEQIVRTYRRVTGRDELQDHNDRQDSRFGRWFWDDDGSLVITARLSPEDGAVVLAALEAGREVDGPATSPAAARPGESAASLLPDVRNADALVAMAKLALSAPAGSEARAPQVVIIDRATLGGETDDGRSYLDGRAAIPPECARRLACDATIAVLLEGADGTPLDLGRRSRTPSARLRRALRRRDGCCRFPGCGARRFLHAHHVRHWARGGETNLANLILVCGRHHRLVHEGGFRIDILPNRAFAFFDRSGRRLPEVPPTGSPAGPSVPARNEAAGLEIGPDTCRSLGEGEAYDLGLTIDAMVSAFGEVDTSSAPNVAA